MCWLNMPLDTDVIGRHTSTVTRHSMRKRKIDESVKEHDPAMASADQVGLVQR